MTVSSTVITRMYSPEALQYQIQTGAIDPNSIQNVSLFQSQQNAAAVKDGSDDGKIGFFEGAKEIFSGAAKSLVKGIGNALGFTSEGFKPGNLLKTALTVGACFIPGVGPVIGGLIAAKGLVSGAVGLANGISNAASATTDAEKRAAFQSIGASGLQTGLSAVGLKAAGSAIAKGAGVDKLTSSVSETGVSVAGKGILGKASNIIKNTGKSVTNYYGGAWSAAKTALGDAGTLKIAGEVAKQTVKETGKNIIGAAKAVNEKVSEKIHKGKTTTTETPASESTELATTETAGKATTKVTELAKKAANTKVGKAATGAINSAKTAIADVPAGYYTSFEGSALTSGAVLTTGLAAAGLSSLDSAASSVRNQTVEPTVTGVEVTLGLEDYHIVSADEVNQMYGEIMQSRSEILNND